MIRADSEIRVRLEKSSDITFLDEGVLAIKRTVNKLKDQVSPSLLPYASSLT